MKWRAIRCSCVALLFGLAYGFGACSSSQQQGVEEAVEGEENYADEGEGGENAAYEGEEGGNNYEDGGNYAEDDSGNGEAYDDENDGQGGNYANAEGETSNEDLQSIIDQGNGADLEEPLATEGSDDAVAVENAEIPSNGGGEPVAVPAGSLPEMGSKMPYIVRVGDSLSKIAKSIYGDSSMYQEMAELSSLKNANMVRPGDVLYYRLSEVTLAFATAYEGTAREELTIQRGDSLSKIAQRVYGSSNDWKYVWRQNDLPNPDQLEVGQKIVYLSPNSFSAAIDFAKSISIAQLIKANFGSEEVVQVELDQVDSGSGSDETVTGFEIAKSMFDVFADQFNVAG